jgi:SNF2 family DNA or RNA helicase
MAPSSEFQTKILRRSAVPDEYKLYRAALEWDLTDPIVIEMRKDLISEKRWQNHLQPYHHQVTNLITFCRRLPVTLLADDVGLGKTISAGLIASELIARTRISKILIVCPKLLGPQWRDELKTKFDIPAVIAAGKKLIKAEPEGVGAVITTYASARLHLDKISFSFTASIRRQLSLNSFA